MASVCRLLRKPGQSFLSKLGSIGARVLGDHGFQCRSARIGLLHLQLAVTKLEQGIGRLVALWILVEQMIEGFYRDLIVGRGVVRLTQPIKRVGCERIVRVFLDEFAKSTRGGDVITRFEGFESGVV